jgi:PAS domain S-box-containing protein
VARVSTTRAPRSADPAGDASRGALIRSRDQLARRVEADRTLHEIATQITALRDPEALLQDVVDHARRLTASDGAHLTLRVEGGPNLQPYVMSGAVDEESRTWFRSIRLEPGSGTNALAAQLGEPVWTSDFRIDPRLPHGPGYGTAAGKMRMIAIAAVPMHGPNREVIGTLSISYEEPREFLPEQIELLQSFADQAAIAVLNSRLFAQLRESEERYRYIVERAPDLLFTTDAAGAFTFLSNSAERLTGWRPEELLGQPFLRIVHPSSLPEVRQRWLAILADPSGEGRLRFLQVRRDGRVNSVESSARAILVDGAFAGVQGIIRDVTEFDRVEQDRRLQAAELAVAQERAHLARELHDSVTQALFSMTLQAGALDRLLERGDAASARERLAALSSLQRDALAEMRALVFALRPPSLEKDGLVQALRAYAAALSQRSGLEIEVSAEDVDRPPPVIEDGLYRIAQEALHNVMKHAHAGRAEVRVWPTEGELHLEVADDGRGFDAQRVPPGHLGVVGMRARAGLMGGRLEIAPRDGGGTVVRVAVPAHRAPGVEINGK